LLFSAGLAAEQPRQVGAALPTELPKREAGRQILWAIRASQERSRLTRKSHTGEDYLKRDSDLFASPDRVGGFRLPFRQSPDESG